MSERTPETQENAAIIRWPTGITTLFGILIGAFVGIVLRIVPAGMVTGLAFGAGIDSILNHLLNAIPANENEDQTE